MFNLTSKMRETILFFLIVVINGLIWIESDIGLDTCARGGGEGWKCWWSFGLEHFVCIGKLKSNINIGSKLELITPYHIKFVVK